MASIREVMRAGGRLSFEVQFRTPARRLTSRTFRTLEAAEAFAATIPVLRQGRFGHSGPVRVPMSERIDRLSKVDENGCWIWQGATTNAGYGSMSIRDKGMILTRGAHRVSYETHVGPIPNGLTIDHLCRVPLCVNPAHLEPVTSRENVLRSPITQAALNAAKTHCPQGHEYTPTNTYNYGPRNEWRLCRTCQRRSNRVAVAAYRARQASS